MHQREKCQKLLACAVATRKKEKNFLIFFKKPLTFSALWCIIMWSSGNRWHAVLAQLDRVFGYEPKGRGFESLTPYQKKVVDFIPLPFFRIVKYLNPSKLRKQFACICADVLSYSAAFHANAGFRIPYTVPKKDRSLSLSFLTDKLKAQKVGRELVFSADLWYNGANEKPLPLGEVAAKPTERVRLWNETPSHPLRGSSPKGRAFGCSQP